MGLCGKGVNMHLEEIIELLKKYQNEYWYPQTIEEINNSIQNISNTLKDVKTYLSNKLYEINSSDSTEDCNENDMLSDIKLIKDKIKEIKGICPMIPVNKPCNEDTEIIFDKNVRIYVTSDNLCPLCNYKLYPYTIYYQRNVNNKINSESVSWYRCSACHKLFVLDYDTEDFDFNDTNIILDKRFCDTIHPIDINSVIVLKNTLKCSFNHNTNDIIAKIPVLDKNGEVYYVETGVSYCSVCNRFTILKDEFDKISDIVTCKVIDETSSSNPGDQTQTNETENDGSILKYYGYNVQTQKNISEQQRHIILSSVIEAGIMSRGQVVDLLGINIKRKSTRPDCQLAIQKWKEDINFVNTYKTEELPKVVFDKIILKYKK